MDIESKLPNAEDILHEHYVKEGAFYNTQYVIKAIHEYAKRLLDVVAENAEVQVMDYTIKEGIAEFIPTISRKGYSINDGQYVMVKQQSILRFKDLLK